MPGRPTAKIAGREVKQINEVKEVKLATAQADLTDERQKTAALAHERDDALRIRAVAARGAASPAPPNGFSSAPSLVLLPPKPLIDAVFTIPTQFLRYNPRTN